MFCLCACKCIRVHKGPCVLHAQDITSDPINPAKGILAGCPFGVVFAKIVLWALMSHVNRVCCPQGMSTWVDLHGFTSAEVAKSAVVTFLELKEGLVSRGLEISIRKSGFLVSDAETGRALRKVLAEFKGCPELKDTIKYLGIDNSLVTVGNGGCQCTTVG